MKKKNYTAPNAEVITTYFEVLLGVDTKPATETDPVLSNHKKGAFDGDGKSAGSSIWGNTTDK